jgi:hypothetical protein
MVRFCLQPLALDAANGRIHAIEVIGDGIERNRVDLLVGRGFREVGFLELQND